MKRLTWDSNEIGFVCMQNDIKPINPTRVEGVCLQSELQLAKTYCVHRNSLRD